MVSELTSNFSIISLSFILHFLSEPRALIPLDVSSIKLKRG